MILTTCFHAQVDGNVIRLHKRTRLLHEERTEHSLMIYLPQSHTLCVHRPSLHAIDTAVSSPSRSLSSERQAKSALAQCKYSVVVFLLLSRRGDHPPFPRLPVQASSSGCPAA